MVATEEKSGSGKDMFLVLEGERGGGVGDDNVDISIDGRGQLALLTTGHDHLVVIQELAPLLATLDLSLVRRLDLVTLDHSLQLREGGDTQVVRARFDEVDRKGENLTGGQGCIKRVGGSFSANELVQERD